MGVAQLNVIQSLTHAQALQFHRKAHKAGGHQGKRIHTRDCWSFCLETQAFITQLMHISSSSLAGSGVSFLLPQQQQSRCYHLWGEERTFTFSWTNTAAGCFSDAGKGNTISHTPLNIVEVQGKLMGFKTLLYLIHGSDAGHHYWNVIQVCIK